jgi:integrase
VAAGRGITKDINMASTSQSPKGLKTIQFIGPDRKRRSIRLGKVPKKYADAVRVKIESLVAAKLTGHAVDDDTARWVASLDVTMSDKLSAVGLTPKRPKATLEAFIETYVSGRVDVKPGTKEVWQQGRNGLLRYFGSGRSLREITPGDADGYKLKLIAEQLAPYTIRKRLQFANTIFRSAVRHKLITENPFAGVNVPPEMSDRQSYVSVDDAFRLLAAAPDHNWRTIVALSRFGGLRCPSEVLSLKITDVDWDAGKMLVTAPKTEHHPGKGVRTVPIFGDLRPWLEEAQQLAPEGAVYLVDERFRRGSLKPTGWRNCNLRTTFEKIVKRAGLTPWPRLFHNMRSSCETDLMQHHPMPTVAAWMGHSVEIATKHYCQITEADFAKAVAHRSLREPKNEPAEAVQKAVQQPAETRRKASQPKIETAVLRGISTGCDASRNETRMGWDSNPRYPFE